MKQLIDKYFGFNSQQRRGLLYLIILSVFLLIIRIVYPGFIQAPDISAEELPLFARDTADLLRSESLKSPESILRSFDPNKSNKEELLSLGFKEKTAERLMKFRKRGFVFRKKEDLKKVYGVTDDFYLKLEPYIVFEKVSNPNAKKSIAPPVNKTENISLKKPQVFIDLNSADSSLLVTVNGIGQVLSGRIIKYRNALGGFHSVMQLKEVYGFKEDLFEKIKSQVHCGRGLTRKLAINTADFKTVNRHPYINYELTKKIFNARRVKPLDEIMLRQLVVDDQLMVRLLPYLDFNMR